MLGARQVQKMFALWHSLRNYLMSSKGTELFGDVSETEYRTEISRPE